MSDLIKNNELAMFIVRDREAGNSIDVFNTLADASEALAEYEAEDKLNQIYEEGFYEIYDVNSERVIDATLS